MPIERWVSGSAQRGGSWERPSEGGSFTVGKSQNLIQLLEPLNDSSPVQKMIDRHNGKGGLAHVGLRVKSAQEAYKYLSENGFRLIDAGPRLGSRGTTVFFVHPKSRRGSTFWSSLRNCRRSE